ncbi:DUF397 domain-containing protein [Micromonospora sp. NBC_01392]|uniref:DUF397 domain-containing protein n=1 Tax=Micromonospora sp. NBC_01392 TaxID=2903588 RepID=UPI00324E889C
MELTGAIWRKSSRSGQSECVEVAGNLVGVVGVRDSKDPTGPVLTFTADAWRAFVRVGVDRDPFTPSSS